MSIISPSFADELTEKEMRDAYVNAQTRVKIAHQIRSLRAQREWSQGKLGELLGKPQGNVSRLEDTQVGKYTLSTLFELASAFDVALLVEFVSYQEFLRRTADLNPEKLEVPSFDRASLEPLCEEHATSAPFHQQYGLPTYTSDAWANALTRISNGNLIVDHTPLSATSVARSLYGAPLIAGATHPAAITQPNQEQSYVFGFYAASEKEDVKESMSPEAYAEANIRTNKLQIGRQMPVGLLQ